MERKNSAAQSDKNYGRVFMVPLMTQQQTHDTTRWSESQFRYRYWKTDGSQKYIQLAVSAVEEALSSQLNQRLFFFFLLFLKGGNVLHELPTRTPPTIQGKHQMMKKNKKTTFFRPEWYIFPPFHLLPRLFRTKTRRHRHLAVKLPTRSIFFATVKNFKKMSTTFW